MDRVAHGGRMLNESEGSPSTYGGDGFGAGGLTSGEAHDESDGLAWFRLVFGTVWLLFGFGCLYVFGKNRNVLEIRSRSAYLVIVLGACLLIDAAVDIHVECVHLFGWPSNVLATHLVFFFTIFTIGSCYISRVVRLGISFNPRIKKAIPWMMSEKLLVVASLTIGALSMFLPGYHYFETTGTDDDHSEFMQVELETVWRCQVALVSIQLCLLPIVWMVDDLFRISWELGIIVMLGLIDVVTLKLSETNVLASGTKEYVNGSNINLIWTTAVLGISVVDPVRRLLFNPMARPLLVSRTVRESDMKSKRPRIRQILNISPESSDYPEGSLTSGSRDESGRFRTEPNSARSTGSWTYAKMAAVPAVAEAFRAFASRALCQESVTFLEEVAKFEAGNYEIANPILSQYQAFNQITRRFIAEGSQDEINISSRDRQKLVGIYNAGSTVFFNLEDEMRRLIFSDAYLEIRSMLEVNLLSRFIRTEGFKRMQSEAHDGEEHRAPFGFTNRT